MGQFEERDLVYKTTCGTCIHCLLIDIDYEEPPYEECFCMLGVSEEERDRIDDELYDIYHCGRCRGGELSEETLDTLMWINAGSLPPESKRLVLPEMCCQFHNK